MRWMRPLLRWWPGRRLLVLAFHRVARDPDPYDPAMTSADRFARELDALAGFEVVPLRQGLDDLAAGRLKRPAVAITFDDGYRDQLEVAQPLLEARGYPSTVFVCPAFIDGPNLWHDRLLWALREGVTGRELPLAGHPHVDDRRVIPEDLTARRALASTCIEAVKFLPLAAREQAVSAIEVACGAPTAPRWMLDRQELRRLADRPGVEIGAHTRHHPILASCSAAEAAEEIAGSRRDLEHLLGRPVPLFAYPNGHAGRDFGEREVQLVRAAGYSHACTSDWGSVHRGTDRWQLPRLGLYHASPWRNALLLLREALVP